MDFTEFSELLARWVDLASTIVWGPFLLIPLLLVTGSFLTIRLGGLQFRALGPAMYLALIVRGEKEGAGDISHFQVLMTAMAASVGTGNIAGAATAMAAGGPGGWHWTRRCLETGGTSVSLCPNSVRRTDD